MYICRSSWKTFIFFVYLRATRKALYIICCCFCWSNLLPRLNDLFGVGSEMRRNEKKIEGNACASDLFSSICLLYKLDIFWFGSFSLVFFYISIYFGLRNSIRKSPALLIYGEIYKNEIRSNQLLKKYFVFFLYYYIRMKHICVRAY